jgi:hypothetical protein
MADHEVFPLEILLEVVKHATTPTIASLCAVNHELYVLVIPTLYRRGVEIAANEQDYRHNLACDLIGQNNYSAVAKLLQFGLSARTYTLWMPVTTRGPPPSESVLRDMSLL